MSQSKPPVYHSQYNEDQILDNLFPDEYIGTCYEVGAHDGKNLSTTLFFEKKGWSCVLIEPIGYLCEWMRRVRKGTIHQFAASDTKGDSVIHIPIGADTLATISPTNSFLARGEVEGRPVFKIPVKTDRLDAVVSGKVDYMSIDVEGSELQALIGLDLDKNRPSILIVENNNTKEQDVSSLLYSKNYGRVLRTGCNDWWFSKDDYPKFIDKLNSLRQKSMNFI